MISSRHQPLPVYLLAGGRSSRFGSDKALAPVDGVPLARRVADQFAAAAAITLVADDSAQYHELGFPIIPDPQPGLGPIGGLLAACEHCRAEGWFWLSGCDTLFSDATAPQQLLKQTTDGKQVVAFKGDVWEPLPALYHASLLPAVQSHIATGAQGIWRMIEKVPHVAIPFPSGRSPILHINTPHDLQAYLRGRNAES